MEQHMIACVHESLGLYLMENARFMAERLVAEYPSQVRSRFEHARLTVLKTRDACFFAQLEGSKMGSHPVLVMCMAVWGCTSRKSLLHDREAGRRVPFRGRGSLVCTGKAVETCSAAGSAQTWTASLSGWLEGLQEALTLAGARLLEGHGHQILQQPESS